jgi:hypothetical protein
MLKYCHRQINKIIRARLLQRLIDVRTDIDIMERHSKLCGFEIDLSPEYALMRHLERRIKEIDEG